MTSNALIARDEESGRDIAYLDLRGIQDDWPTPKVPHRSQIYRWIAAGKFPPGVRFGPRLRFWSHEQWAAYKANPEAWMNAAD